MIAFLTVKAEKPKEVICICGVPSLYFVARKDSTTAIYIATFIPSYFIKNPNPSVFNYYFFYTC